MDRWERLGEQARATAEETELRSVDHALWQKNDLVCLAVDRGLEAKGQTRNPQKPPWFVAAGFLLLGSMAFILGISHAAPVSWADTGQVVAMLPFNPIFTFSGLLFIGIGYCLLGRISRLALDPGSRRWTLQSGVLPFLKTHQGTLDTGAIHWKIAAGTHNSIRGRSDAVWTLRLVGVPAAPGFLALSASDLRQSYVERDVALQAFEKIAERTGIPLIKDVLTDPIPVATPVTPLISPSVASFEPHTGQTETRSEQRQGHGTL